MTLCLFEDAVVRHLEPLTLTRAAADLRIGARTQVERLRMLFPTEALAIHVRSYLAEVTAQENPDALVNPKADGPVLLVNARWIAERGDLARRLQETPLNTAFLHNQTLVAAVIDQMPAAIRSGEFLRIEDLGDVSREEVSREEGRTLRMAGRLTDLIADLEELLAADLGSEQFGQHDSARIGAGVVLLAEEKIRLAKGVAIEPLTLLDATSGPVVLEADVRVEAGAILRGPVWIGRGATVKAGARVDGSAIGPRCKVAGEVHGSVMHSLANKAHAGYMGNSYLGRWCNLGAGTDTSNLKNNYGEISVYDAVANDLLPSGRQFAGLFMGDHSKCAIGTTFNTGTVVGVSSNVYGAAFPPQHIPSFAWGGAAGLQEYRLDKALDVAETVMGRRDIPLTDADREMLSTVFARTAEARSGF
ncbi:GlmU family protein [soil metagenome]